MLNIESEEVSTRLYNRDLSWLSFNEHILREAGKKQVPLLESINFLAIFSSNLDEFYRVRMPVLLALKKIKHQENIDNDSQDVKIYKQVKLRIKKQLSLFGSILVSEIIPALKSANIHFIYNETIPDTIVNQTKDYFYERIASYLEISIIEDVTFFPKNNQLYFVFTFKEGELDKLGMISIPSDQVSRFYYVATEDKNYIVFIDDIIRQNFPDIFKDHFITGMYSFKVTRDAELELNNEFEGSLLLKIEKQIRKRDFGLATRLLYQPDLPDDLLSALIKLFKLRKSSCIKGGNYHNLKDFFSFPIDKKEWKYRPQPPIPYRFKSSFLSLLDEISVEDILVNTPYESYDVVLRFFNEAAVRRDVEEIYISMYRVASDSKILHAVLNAVKNGKKVTVFVELKARFDEENNIYWAKKLKAAGVNVLYSIPNLKVHAKIALVKTKQGNAVQYFGLLSTGNLNEKTAHRYADHVLLTAQQEILQEVMEVFNVLKKRLDQTSYYSTHFKYLLVSQYNLAAGFMQLIDQEIASAKMGLPAWIIIKVNNLEEKGMIQKLYEASQAGVVIQLIVRSICRLIPGVAGLSENISVRRIVDRYLEHSRVFIFNNNGQEQVYLGSADWMHRNIYNRIEVCFPIVNRRLKKEIQTIIAIQLEDDTSAEVLDEHMDSIERSVDKGIRAQECIYDYCKQLNE
ncbi:polyphosphate kinase 1 [Sphingobacterium kitahiroshimense]|uniref:Polyphosphate kinase n=1 Tax=Sphingobacterium kitahiroshimense TaxID=470446 RepID=A0ABV0BVL3_9SPHI